MYYSSRNAVMGSVRDARRAGKYAATIATKASVAAAPTSVGESLGLSP
jgi:hypothetical protein